MPKSEDNFFTWCTPGIPVDPSDFGFLTQGLTGVVKKQALLDIVQPGQPPAAGATPPPAPAITPALLDQLRASDTGRLYMQAENLARLVDFVPDVSRVTNDQFAKFNVQNNDGTLSEIYDLTLRMSQVMKQDLPDDVKKQIEHFRSLLNVTTKTKDLISGEDVEHTVPSPLVVAYTQKMQAYDAAALQYNSHRIDALTADNPRAIHDWAINANIYRNEVKAAMDDWISSGYKVDFEKIAAFIEQVQARDLSLLKAEYEDDLQKAKLTGIASGSDFYYTSLVPGSFASTGGWTGFGFSSSDYDSRSNSSFSSSQWSASGGGSYLGIFGGSASSSGSDSHSEYHGSFNSDFFNFSFEICQVPIVRPWFKSSFFVGKTWRFDVNNPDMKDKGISDGGKPPKGLMPAYPMSIVFIRNLSMSFGEMDAFADYASNTHSSTSGGGGYVALGPIFLGGSSSYSSQNGNTSSDYHFHRQGNTMTVPGMQVIGFKCHVLPKSPDPLSTIKDWI